MTVVRHPVYSIVYCATGPAKPARRKSRVLGNLHSLMHLELKLLSEVVSDLGKKV